MIFKKTLDATLRTNDNIENHIVNIIKVFFEKWLVWVYDKILMRIFAIFMAIVQWILFVPMFVFFLPFATAYEIYTFVSTVKYLKIKESQRPKTKDEIQEDMEI